MDLREHIEAEEGLRLKPYPCTKGKWTIGIGHNFEANPFSRKDILFDMLQRKRSSRKKEEFWLANPESYLFAKGITEKTARYIFQRDMKNTKRELGTFFSQKTLGNLTKARRNVLTDMLFQMGHKKFSGFTKMIAAVKDSKHRRAAFEIFSSQYAKDTPKRAARSRDRYLRGFYK